MSIRSDEFVGLFAFCILVDLLPSSVIKGKLLKSPIPFNPPHFVDSIFVNLPVCCNLFLIPKSILMLFSWSFVDMHRAVKYLSLNMRIPN